MTVNLHLTLDGHDPAAAIEAMLQGAALLSTRRWWRRPVQIWLSGALARPYVFGPVAGLQGWTEVHEAAAALAPAACGLIGPCAACVETDPRTHSALATAVEASLLEALYAAARQRKLHIASIRPWWVRATERHARLEESDLLLCCRDPDAMTVVAARARQIVFAATYAPTPSEEDVTHLLRRLRASLGLAEEATAVAELERPTGHTLPALRWADLQIAAAT